MLDRITAALLRRHLHRVSDGTIDLSIKCDGGVTITVPLTAEATECPVLPGVYLGAVTIGREDDAA